MTDQKNLLIRWSAATLDKVCNAVAARPWVEANPILTDIAAQVQALQKEKAPEGALRIITDVVDGASTAAH